MTLKLIFLIGHVIGVALGVGGATVSDALFLTSIFDNKIDKSELKLMKMASFIVIAGLLLLMVTGTGFFLVGGLTSARFYAKMTIVFIATLNGVIMHYVAFPIFERCVKERLSLLSAEFTRHAPLLVTAGAVSAVSWYTALILGMWRTLETSYSGIMAVYLSILLFAIVSANLIVQFGLRQLLPTQTLTQQTTQTS